MYVRFLLVFFSVSSFLTLTSIQSFAQSAQIEMEIIQEAFGLDKKMAIASFMKLGEKEANFWELYDAYEAERKELGKKRIDVIVAYANSYPSISDEEILDLYERSESIKKSFAELQDNYFQKMKEQVGVRQAAQFWQLENYFNVVVQANIYSQLPFIQNEDGD